MLYVCREGHWTYKGPDRDWIGCNDSAPVKIARLLWYPQLKTEHLRIAKRVYGQRFEGAVLETPSVEIFEAHVQSAVQRARDTFELPEIPETVATDYRDFDNLIENEARRLSASKHRTIKYRPAGTQRSDIDVKMEKALLRTYLFDASYESFNARRAWHRDYRFMNDWERFEAGYRREALENYAKKQCQFLRERY